VNLVDQVAKVCAVNAVHLVNKVLKVLQVDQVFLDKEVHAGYREETLENQVLKVKLVWKVHQGHEVTTVAAENPTSKGHSVKSVLKGSTVNAAIQVCQLKWVQSGSEVSPEGQAKMVKQVELVTVELQEDGVFQVNSEAEVVQDHVALLVLPDILDTVDLKVNVVEMVSKEKKVNPVSTVKTVRKVTLAN